MKYRSVAVAQSKRPPITAVFAVVASAAQELGFEVLFEPNQLYIAATNADLQAAGDVRIAGSDRLVSATEIAAHFKNLSSKIFLAVSRLPQISASDRVTPLPFNDFMKLVANELRHRQTGGPWTQYLLGRIQDLSTAELVNLGDGAAERFYKRYSRPLCGSGQNGRIKWSELPADPTTRQIFLMLLERGLIEEVLLEFANRYPKRLRFL